MKNLREIIKYKPAQIIVNSWLSVYLKGGTTTAMCCLDLLSFEVIMIFPLSAYPSPCPKLNHIQGES